MTQTHSLAYGRLGAVGVLTPSGNPTVEPELARLLSDDVLMLTARMLSGAPTLLDRLRAYAEELEQSVARFGGVPLRHFLFACTGSSYLIGPEAEDALVKRFATRGLNMITASHAIRAALQSLDVSRVVLVNPYPADLKAEALKYWAAVGLDLATVVEAENPDPGYHAIYTLQHDTVRDALNRAQKAARELGAGAILFTGTGMASLATIAATPAAEGVPLLSSNMALAWKGLCDLGRDMPFARFVADDAPWRRRFSPA